MLTIKDLKVTRGNFSLSIPELEINGRNSFIFGRNGSGKSTLLLCIAGLLPHTGEIRKDEKIWELSHGEAQRVAVARALVSSPSLLLMDEPFSMQDEISRINSLALIDDLSKSYNFDYIYVTHNPKDLDMGFSTLVSLDDGKLVEYVHSIEEIKHFRTLSLLDYSKIISIDNEFYRIIEKNISFDDNKGYDFKLFKNDGQSILRISIDGRYAFIRFSGDVNGKKIILDDALEKIPY